MAEHGNEVYAAIAAQVQQLQGAEVSDDVIETALSVLTAGAVDTISGAVSACITLVEHGEIVTIAATSPLAAQLDELQAHHQIGPCLESAWTQEHVRIDDYTTDRRWPAFISDVLTQTPVRASMSFQLHRDATSMSALNLHATTPHAFDERGRALGHTFAAQAAVSLHAGTRQTQFHQALASRDQIGQAKGLLMERYDIGADQAFALLRRLSQDSNIKVSELARRLVTLDHPDTPEIPSGDPPPLVAGD